ncbi:uroporphyrinogen-III synthase [Pulveribacter suum]|uniref:Uroporphyrinogen-III synthase n=1 Tax=Pulveribacter suum TaxID=2116657 RepID=A0A2P1NMV1_9BURK|nr:uroporphyrinogen-III synthase [Pulveribacter suum]AVP58375.1 uroporphyrinogen-III synthase [Pulveribacter suum]
MNCAPRALVTRPAHDAAQWVRDLAAQGVVAQALPLIGIRSVAAPVLAQALQQARAAAPGYRALMFVSGNAVTHFFEPNVALALTGQAPAAINTRAWAPGPGTVQALLAAGMPAARIDAPPASSAQFDSEALWPVVAPQLKAGDCVLIVRGASAPAAPGGSGREWLAARLAEAGVQVDFVAAYERCAPALDASALALARQGAQDGSLWLLSSSEALAHLAQALPGQDWQRARALATHPRIAQAARATGFGQVHECRPALADVAASIKSLHAR